MQVKVDELVNPNKVIADYRTDITGVSERDLEGVTCIGRCTGTLGWLSHFLGSILYLIYFGAFCRNP